MSPSVPLHRRLATTATWPLGLVITSWSYIWRTTVVHRDEQEGSIQEDLPPELPEGIALADAQLPRSGSGPLFNRLYSGAITGTDWSPERLMERIQSDPDRVAPWSLARFHKAKGDPGRLAVGDEFVVRMPAPWDGPVRVVEVTPRSFRLMTLEDHLEAGQIEWRAFSRGETLVFQVQSWSRQGDRLSALLHEHVRMAKEVQLLMWTSVVENVARLVGGQLEDGIEVLTRRVAAERVAA